MSATRSACPYPIGVARTKHLAKVASQVAKPDGLVVVEPESESDFLGPLPIGLIWGVGPATELRLHEAGIYTIGQLARAGSPIGVVLNLYRMRLHTGSCEVLFLMRRR